MDNISEFDAKCGQIFKSIHELREAGYSNRSIAKLLHVSRQTVIKYVNGSFEELCRKTLRKSILDDYHDYIVKSLKAGTSRKDVYRNIVAMGFEGEQSGAYSYMNKLIQHYGIDISFYRSISADAVQQRKDIGYYDYFTRTDLFKALWMNCDIPCAHRNYLFSKYSQLFELSICIKEFRRIFDEQRPPLLYLFIEKYKQSKIKALSVFAKGLDKDIEAVENAVSSNLSNGFVEGTVSKLKMIKKVMYGRCSRELLTAKMMYNPSG